MAVCFLWHFPASHLGLPLAITLLCEVRTFLDSMPDLWVRHEPRPPGQLVRTNTVLVAESADQRHLTIFQFFQSLLNKCVGATLTA